VPAGQGAGSLSRRQLGVLEELLQWREREAERRDRPLFQVVGTTTLLTLAQQGPATASELAAIDGLPSRLADRYGRDLLAAIQRGRDLPESELPLWPRPPRPERDPAVDARLAALKEWRRGKAAALGLEPGVLINNALLEALARERPTRAAVLQGFPGLKRWQYLELGEELLAVLR